MMRGALSLNLLRGRTSSLLKQKRAPVAGACSDFARMDMSTRSGNTVGDWHIPRPRQSLEGIGSHSFFLCGKRILSESISVKGIRGFSSNIARRNHRVSCHMSVENPDKPGEFAMDTRKGEGFPLSFIVGQGQVIPGLEKRVEGMAEGEEWSGELEPMEAFGIRSEKAVVRVPLSKDEPPPEKGHIVHLATEFGGRVGRVLSVSDGTAVVDTNHEFADKTIRVWIKVVEVEEEEDEDWSGVHHQTFAEGDGITYPVHGDTVSVKYAGMLASNGKIFDTSDETGPIEFEVGAGQVIRGWEEGIKKLTLGEKARVFVSSEFAYGTKGAGGEIPPNANLVFDIHLVKINGKEIL